MTDSELALILDPQRTRAGWWNAGMFCKACNGDWLKCGCTDLPVETLFYTGPPLTTDRVAAFTHVTPVLLAAGCRIRLTAGACVIEFATPFGYSMVVDEVDGIATACAQAIAWLQQHEPERLAKAVEACNELA